MRPGAHRGPGVPVRPSRPGEGVYGISHLQKGGPSPSSPMMWQARTGAAGVVPRACPSFLPVPMPGAAGRTGADQPSKAQDHFRGLTKMIGTSYMSGAQGTHRRSTPPEAGIDARAALQGPFGRAPTS
nr:MAG TPA: hypothetical protein [Caudoviricetes sp.]